MRYDQTFSDARHRAFCVYCHGVPTTKDHVPARIFLDDPFPAHLVVVGSCSKCNLGASSDEEYVACLLEVVACGTVSPGQVQRPAIARVLERRPRLARRLADAFDSESGAVAVEVDRLQNVLRKIALGLWAHETGEPLGDHPAQVTFAALSTLDGQQLQHFESVGQELLPELGSRMFTMTIEGGDGASGWEVVQEARFRYAISTLTGAGSVKMVVRNLLAAEVSFAWE